MTRRDEHLWDEEVVEIFIDLDRSGRDYYELEVNPANVVCDLRMISPWPDKKGDIDWDLGRARDPRPPLGATPREGRRAGRRPPSSRGAGCESLPSAERSRCPRSPATPGASTSSGSRGPVGRTTRRRTPCSPRGRPRPCRASTTPGPSATSSSKPLHRHGRAQGRRPGRGPMAWPAPGLFSTWWPPRSGATPGVSGRAAPPTRSSSMRRCGAPTSSAPPSSSRPRRTRSTRRAATPGPPPPTSPPPCSVGRRRWVFPPAGSSWAATISAPIPGSASPRPMAMEKAREMIRHYVRAGAAKIHLDASMSLADDPGGRSRGVARRRAHGRAVRGGGGGEAGGIGRPGLRDRDRGPPTRAGSGTRRRGPR